MADTLASALAELQQQLPIITKGEAALIQHKNGGSHTVKYADLARVSTAILPLLGKLGMSFTARPTLNEHREFVLAYSLKHVSGGSLDGEYPLPKGASQDVGSAITFARRYTLCAVTGIAPEGEDDDGHAAQQAATKRERPARPQQRQQADEPEPDDDRITSAQIRLMQGLFGRAGVTDRDDKLKYAREVVRREIGSSTELTKAEAGQVIDKLERWAKQEEPPLEAPEAGA